MPGGGNRCGSSNAYLSAVSPTLGRFRFDAVPPGRWTVQVEAPGFVPFERVVDVAAGGAAVHLDVALDEGLVVSGVVRAAAGVRLAGVSLLLERTDIDAWTLAGVGADGVFRASGLTAGRYRVSVTYPNAGIWDKALCPSRTLVLDVSASSSPMRCDVEVVRGGWLNFGVSKGLVAGRSDVRLKFTDADSRVVYDEPIEPERCGILWTSAFPVGAYNIRLEAGGALLAEKQATVVDGTPAKVYFDG